MRTSQFLVTTLKEVPADAEIVSHQYMLRSGMVRKLAYGKNLDVGMNMVLNYYASMIAINGNFVMDRHMRKSSLILSVAK